MSLSAKEVCGCVCVCSEEDEDWVVDVEGVGVGVGVLAGGGGGDTVTDATTGLRRCSTVAIVAVAIGAA